MKNSKETRTCISCRKKDNKRNLLRIVKTRKLEVVIDKEQNLEGRGAYICKDEKCLNKLIKDKKLSKALKTSISNKEYDELRGVIFDR